MYLNKMYFDNAATGFIETPTLENYSQWAFMRTMKYNPSSAYELSKEAKRAIEQARGQLKNIIRANEADDLVFTSGGSESNNLAIKGWAFAQKGEGYIYLSPIEHPSVINTVKWLYEFRFIKGYTFLPVEHYGRVDNRLFDELLEIDKHKNFLVSVMFTNNETGISNDIKTLAKITHKYGGVFFTDAVQAFGHIAIDVENFGVDMLSVSGHKIGVPRGCGFLYIRDGIKIEPLIHGGHQEKGLRAGTENTLDILMLSSHACEIYKHIDSFTRKESKLYFHLKKLLREKVAPVCEYKINGDTATFRSYGVVSITFKGIDAQRLITDMDVFEHFQISAGSACSAGEKEPSYVLLAMGLSEEETNSTIRISYNFNYTFRDVEFMVDALVRCIKRIQIGGGL